MPEPTQKQQIVDDTPYDGPATCGATLVDVGFDPLGGRWPRAVGRVFLAFGALIVAFILAAILGVATGSIIVAMLPVAILIVGGVMMELLWRRTFRQESNRVVRENKEQPLAEFLRDCLGKEGQVCGSLQYRVDVSMRALLAAGRLNNAIRISTKPSEEAVKPFRLIFEPQPLDETDPTFLQLEALDAIGPIDTEALRDADFKSDATWLRVKRNIALRGGWIVIGFLLLYVLMLAWRSYRQGVVKWELVLFSAYLVFALSWNVGAWSWRKQWLAVPGGLILRKAGLCDRRWRLYVFRPCDSILALYKRGRHQWVLCIACEGLLERTIVTKREADFVLRAWLSPLLPPPVEKLADLV